MEWSSNNLYNSFNSAKGLTYYQNYQKIVSWMEGRGKLPPPVECNLDPIAYCNVNCYFCITQRYLRAHKDEVGPMRVLPLDYIYRLIDFLAEWGVKGFCVSGGGEPALHPGFSVMVEHAIDRGMKAAAFTNGTTMTEAIADALLQCQFVSLSVNAADRETYKQVMGKDLFVKMDSNLRFLTKRRTNSDAFLCVRMLVLPENYQQIHKVCKWAKEIGMGGFNVRPVDFERQDILGHKRLDLPVEAIQEQFSLCHEEEDINFKVFTVTEKYDPNFHVIHDFTDCLATPLLIPILQDGNAYVCVDKKMEHDFKLGPCFPDPERILEWWGSDRHREALKTIDIHGCSRCTFGRYNRQIREVVMNDSMMVSFP